MTKKPAQTIDIDVGQKIRISISSGRIWSTVRGWKAPHIILVDTPESGDSAPALLVGTRCQTQYLREGIIHRFDTKVLEIMGSSPVSRLMSLKYPERIKVQNLRAFPRIRIHLPANAIDAKNQGWSCTVLDISSGGCGIEIHGTTFTTGEILVLSCLLPHQRMLSDVQSVVKNAYGSHQYGLEFRNLNIAQRKVLDEFQGIFTAAKLGYSGPEVQGGIIGNLEDITLPDLLQVLSHTHKSYHVDITDGSECGYINVVDGDIVHAKTSLLSGEDALFEMFLCSKAECRIQRVESTPERNVHAQLGHLLLEFACGLDEGRFVEGQRHVI